MKTRPLGKTGYTVSELGHGAWGLGGDMWRGVDDADGREALRQAVDHGITFFDTALVYGDGHSEQLIGKTLKDDIRAGRVVVATKIPPMNRIWPGQAKTPLAQVFPARHILDSTEQSLKNLGVEAISAQPLHAGKDARVDETWWEKTYVRFPPRFPRGTAGRQKPPSPE